MSGFVQPVTLRGDRWVSLEPLTPGHAAEITAAAQDVTALWFTSAPTPATAQDWIDGRLVVQHPNTGLTFVVRDANGTVVGSSSYYDVDPANRRLEIGYTWYAQSRQKTRVNPAAKFLLMRHAFETLGAQLVGWRTDGLNRASQRAIERLGARKDGTLRHHALRRDGSVRDTVMYSMAAAEWPAARAALEERLAA